jgi:tetratricopeptide (TPR) repeat protein
MLDNYASETAPLFKLLQAEAFRFIIVRFSHYSLPIQLKKDLHQHFPGRKSIDINAGETDYRRLMDAYYALGSGFLFLHDFEKILSNPDIYTGLNLRRDKLAKYPIALIAFIAPGADPLYARDIMDKMPDLWSFRSLMLDLKKEDTQKGFNFGTPYPPILIEGNTNYKYISNVKTINFDFLFESEANFETINVSSLGGSTIEEKEKELTRLLANVKRTPINEIAQLLILYDQIKTIQSDIGKYQEALITIEKLEQLLPDGEQMDSLLIEKGDLFKMTGQFEKAMISYTKVEENVNLLSLNSPGYGVPSNRSEIQILSYEQIGVLMLQFGNIAEAQKFLERANKALKEIYSYDTNREDIKHSLANSYLNLGDLYHALTKNIQALKHYKEANQLEKELCEQYPNNISFINALGFSYLKLGNIHTLIGNMDKAVKFLEKSYQLATDLAKDYPSNIEILKVLATTCLKSGELHQILEDNTSALDFFERSLSLMSNLNQLFPNNIDIKNDFAISYYKLGAFYFRNMVDNEKALYHINCAEKLFKELKTALPHYSKFQYSIEAVLKLKLALLFNKNHNDSTP